MNERDLIDLNAYLDGELTDQERVAFESRLAQDAVLRGELQALRATVAVLQMAEPIRAPRNFTLDPAVYGKPERRSLWDRLGLPAKILLPAGAAIVATLVCVGAIVFYGSGSGASAPMVAEESAADMQQMEAAEAPLPTTGEAAAAAAAEEAMEEPAAEEPMMEIAPAEDDAYAAGEATLDEEAGGPGEGEGEPPSAMEMPEEEPAAEEPVEGTDTGTNVQPELPADGAAGGGMLEPTATAPDLLRSETPPTEAPRIAEAETEDEMQADQAPTATGVEQPNVIGQEEPEGPARLIVMISVVLAITAVAALIVGLAFRSLRRRP